jgi:hypothetical protein
MFSKIGAAVFLVGMLGVACFVPAQSLSPTPHTPDLLGIYPGMPAAAARTQMQKLSSTVNVQSASPADSGFGISITDPKNPNSMNVTSREHPMNRRCGGSLGLSVTTRVRAVPL